MQKVDSPLARWWWGGLALSFLLVVTADQLTKNLLVRSYDEGGVIWQLGFFRLIHVQNTGAAFGIFPGHSFALKIAAMVGIVVLLVMGFLVYRRIPALVSRLNIIAFGLILGGIVGNLIDRLRWDYVTDFIDFGVWPAFNIADSAVTVGVVIIAYSLLRLTITEMRHSP
ncbi:MAG: signal peptidase II [Dehalococcoidales bacterium]|nr:MAG: signal peptidase II [Dehalococcoidales bacterium]